MLPDPPGKTWETWVIALALAVLTAAVYAQVTGFEFTSYDDDLYVTENRFVQEGLGWAGVRWAFTTTHGDLWHPGAWISLMLDAEIYGLNPGGFHLTNLILHIANTLLLFGLLARMTGAVWQSAFVAALFALHPLHVESVAWISERKDVLSTFFWMLALWAYLAYAKSPGLQRYLLVALCFGAALLCKPMAVTLPVVMLILDYWPLGRWKKAGSFARGRHFFSAHLRPWLLVEKMPFLALGAAVSLLTMYAMPPSDVAVGAASLLERLQTATVAYAFYLMKMVWPSNLSVIYPHPGAFPAWVLGAALVSLVCISVLAVRERARRPYLLMGWLWYLVTLLPVSGVVSYGAGFWMAADRYTYIPLVGPFIMIAWLAPELTDKWRYRRVFFSAAAGIALVILMTITWHQVRVWENHMTLFEHSMSARPGNWPAMHQMALFLMQEGRAEEAFSLWREALYIRPEAFYLRFDLGSALLKQGQPEQAVTEFRKALRTAPESVQGHILLAEALKVQGRLAESRAYLERAIELAPRFPEAHNNLGLVFAAEGNAEAATRHYQEALRLEPEYLAAHINLGSLLFKEGDLEGAILQFRRAVEINPAEWKSHYSLAMALGRQGKVEEAMLHYQETLRINPAIAPAWLNLGIILERHGRIDQAVLSYGKALSIRPDFAEAHYLLGSIFARQGRRDQAREHQLVLQKINPPLAQALLREIEEVQQRR